MNTVDPSGKATPPAQPLRMWGLSVLFAAALALALPSSAAADHDFEECVEELMIETGMPRDYAEIECALMGHAGRGPELGDAVVPAFGDPPGTARGLLDLTFEPVEVLPDPGHGDAPNVGPGTRLHTGDWGQPRIVAGRTTDILEDGTVITRTHTRPGSYLERVEAPDGSFRERHVVDGNVIALDVSPVNMPPELPPGPSSTWVVPPSRTPGPEPTHPEPTLLYPPRHSIAVPASPGGPPSFSLRDLRREVENRQADRLAEFGASLQDRLAEAEGPGELDLDWIRELASGPIGERAADEGAPEPTPAPPTFAHPDYAGEPIGPYLPGTTVLGEGAMIRHTPPGGLVPALQSHYGQTSPISEADRARRDDLLERAGEADGLARERDEAAEELGQMENDLEQAKGELEQARKEQEEAERQVAADRAERSFVAAHERARDDAAGKVKRLEDRIGDLEGGIDRQKDKVAELDQEARERAAEARRQADEAEAERAAETERKAKERAERLAKRKEEEQTAKAVEEQRRRIRRELESLDREIREMDEWLEANNEARKSIERAVRLAGSNRDAMLGKTRDDQLRHEEILRSLRSGPLAMGVAQAGGLVTAIGGRNVARVPAARGGQALTAAGKSAALAVHDALPFLDGTVGVLQDIERSQQITYAQYEQLTNDYRRLERQRDAIQKYRNDLASQRAAKQQQLPRAGQ